MGDDIEQLAAFNAEVVCEPPNNILSKFEGILYLNSNRDDVETRDGRREVSTRTNEDDVSADVSVSRGTCCALDNDRLLLRGCVLRNTEWCFGLVVFAGRETKLMMNSGKTTFKRTNIDRLMNVLIVGIFFFLAAMCVVCAIGSGLWETFIGYKFRVYLPWADYVPADKHGGAAVIAVLQFFSYIVILNTVVPISLYVSVEMIRFGHSWWINWDRKMYYEKTDTPAKSRTTTLNEELGQIEYIFSDKTGTLTQNVMTFNKCSIYGHVYGDVFDRNGRAVDITENTPKVDFSANQYYEKKFEFFDKRLLDQVRQSDTHTLSFFRLLALCHTVMSTEKNGRLDYQAQSPDEAALVSAARNFGFVFKTRTPTSITLEILGIEEVYELLCFLDFDNVRKRMSVIVKKDGKITLFCKGADSTIYQRLDSSCAKLQTITTVHLESFAQDGLRTLCCVVKDISQTEYDEWKVKHHEASISLEDRDAKVAAVYEQIETNLQLIGATAVEDKLQDGVPETIANLLLADIKIWVLTGDKQETAANIGFSCTLLTDEMREIHIIDADMYDDVKNQLQTAYNKMEPSQLHHTSNGSTATNRQANDGDFALIINGHSLEHALQPDMELLLLETACRCKSVICCRVTPLQKARVVELVKKHRKSITLAIGDGANDVSMIKSNTCKQQSKGVCKRSCNRHLALIKAAMMLAGILAAAHIGVGISGQEGMQAVLACDYSLAQFAFLERLLLVHGRWSYIRMCKFLKYFFYKNFTFTLCHFWYAFFNGYSAQTLFDASFITLYNIVYTSLPVMALGFLDQDVSDSYSVRYPKLYQPGHVNLFFNKRVFAESVAEGIVSSAVLFFVPYAALQDAVQANGTDAASFQSFGTVVSSILIIVVSLRCCLDMSYWTGINHFVLWGSVAVYFALTLFLYTPNLIFYSYDGVASNVWSTASFWFTTLLCCVLLLLPVVGERFYCIDMRPTLADRVRLRQRVVKLRARAGDRVVRRASTLSRGTLSRRSVGRSGYAFAHQQGFGQLITSGSIMKGGGSLSKQRIPPVPLMTAADWSASQHGHDLTSTFTFSERF